MKNSKPIIAVLCAIVLIFSLVACAQQKAKTEKVTQVVTDANGQAVTGENGEAVTEEVMAQVVTDKDGKAVTEIVTGTDGKPLTTVVNKKYVNVTQAVTQAPSGKTTKAKEYPSQTTTKKKKGKKTSTTKKGSKPTTTKKGKTAPNTPANVSKLTASSITQTSLKLSWNSVKCSGYQLAVSSDGGKTWKYLEKEYKATSYTVKKLVSNTVYLFRVRAYNTNSAGKTPSDWKTVKAKTKATTEARKIKISVMLPIDGEIEDVLSIYINNKKVKSETVHCNGDTFEFTTKEEYKGEVEITASLEKHGTITIKTDKSKASLEVPLARIPVLIDDED